MLYLVTGGSGSGKSEYAEKVICELCENAGGGKKIYIATMIPYGEETRQKIERHRMMRAKKMFETEECYMDLSGFSDRCMKSMEEPTYVLLECMSNLIANELFESDGTGENTFLAVTEGLQKLMDCCRDIVVVTNEVCSESGEDSAEMQRYKQILAAVNCWMAERAEKVVEVVYGTPLVLRLGKKMLRTEDRSAGMKLIIGGAFQGKRAYVEEQYPGIRWVDGETCDMEAIFSCEGLLHFEEYVKRLLKKEQKENLAEQILTRNPSIVIVGNEIGYGLVPIDPFERYYREQYGRICTALAQKAEQVVRVVCGIGISIKVKRQKEETEDAD